MKKRDEKPQSNIRVRIGGNATGNAIGENASVKANIIAGGSVNQDDEIGKLFEQILSAVNARRIDQKVDKEEIIEVVQELLAEANKAEQADEIIIKRRLRSISRMAPDILDVIIETFKNPISGIVTVIRKIALKVKQEAQEE